jgi:diguanylate cyclase (GGDEF)-like protein
MSSQLLSSQLLQNVLDSLPDGILIVSGERKMVYTNDRFRELWGIPLTEPVDDEGAAVMRYALSKVEDPDAFIQVLESLHQTSEPFEDDIRLRDGRTYKRRSVSFNDIYLGQSRIWIFTDVTAIRNSHFDRMTGLFNRNHFETQWPKMFTGISKESLLGIALFDIDHFKLFNDTYGHTAGDHVLRRIGEVIRSHLKQDNDAAFRVGGEEFFVQVVGRTDDDILKVIENIRSDIELLKIEHLLNVPFNRVTISCGLGIYDRPQDADHVYHQIDQALYISKGKGRNRITFANSLSVSESV